MSEQWLIMLAKETSQFVRKTGLSDSIRIRNLLPDQAATIVSVFRQTKGYKRKYLIDVLKYLKVDYYQDRNGKIVAGKKPEKLPKKKKGRETKSRKIMESAYHHLINEFGDNYYVAPPAKFINKGYGFHGLVQSELRRILSSCRSSDEYKYMDNHLIELSVFSAYASWCLGDDIEDYHPKSSIGGCFYNAYCVGILGKDDYSH